jgi:hypothetical protein
VLNGALGVVVSPLDGATGRLGVLLTSPLRAAAARPGAVAARPACVRRCDDAQLLQAAFDLDAALHPPGEPEDATHDGWLPLPLEEEEEDPNDPLWRATERVRLAHANLGAAAAAAAAPLNPNTCAAARRERTEVSRLHAEAVALADAARSAAEAFIDKDAAPGPADEPADAFAFRAVELCTDAIAARGDAYALEWQHTQAVMDHEMSVMISNVSMGDVAAGGLDFFRPFSMDAPPVAGHLALAQLYAVMVALLRRDASEMSADDAAKAEAAAAEYASQAAEHRGEAAEPEARGGRRAAGVLPVPRLWRRRRAGPGGRGV